MQGQYLASTALLIKLTFLFLIELSNRLFDVLPQDLAPSPQRDELSELFFTRPFMQHHHFWLKARKPAKLFPTTSNVRCVECQLANVSMLTRSTKMVNMENITPAECQYASIIIASSSQNKNMESHHNFFLTC